MVSEEDVKNNFDDILDDIREHVNRFGQVLEIYIPQNGRHLGNVYLEFPTVAEAKSVRKALSCLTFNGENLRIGFIPFEKFKEKDLDVGGELEVIINA
jgi:RNA recognition motif-containing protein